MPALGVGDAQLLLIRVDLLEGPTHTRHPSFRIRGAGKDRLERLRLQTHPLDHGHELGTVLDLEGSPQIGHLAPHRQDDASGVVRATERGASGCTGLPKDVGDPPGDADHVLGTFGALKTHHQIAANLGDQGGEGSSALQQGETLQDIPQDVVAILFRRHRAALLSILSGDWPIPQGVSYGNISLARGV